MAVSQTIDDQCISTIRTVCPEMVQAAKSGHPGAPMGMAAMAHVLWSRVLRFSPSNPSWANRDRFVLSNGHACALHYMMLHLCGYDLTMDDLKNFRQIGSKTPGHPEAHETPGIEVTTGPLGQGIANAVGMAIASRHQAAVFNKPGLQLCDNKVYVFCGDGCLQEGVAAEAASLAGHLGLGNIIMLYDDNQISIDGSTDLSFTEDVAKRFESYGWHTQIVADGNSDLDGIEAAIRAAQSDARPSIISVKTAIGFGSEREGTAKAHGAPLGDDLIEKVKQKFGQDPAHKFYVSDAVRAKYQEVQTANKQQEETWNQLFAKYREQYPKEAAEFQRIYIDKQLPANWESVLPTFGDDAPTKATRATSGACLDKLTMALPELIGGSADLTPSNNTAGFQKQAGDFQAKSPEGRYLRFGVREHAMVAIGNGLASYGLIPFTATFLEFLTYCYPAVRLAALTQQQQVLVFTHDSIFLGEDGPTHQPVEVNAMIRATPNLGFFRPADGTEVAASWKLAIQNKTGPTLLALSRQGLPNISATSAAGVAQGGYVIRDVNDSKPTVVLVASGSEVSAALAAADKLEADNSAHKVRVVSMPSTVLFDQQSGEYRRSVLPLSTPIVSIEAAMKFGWERYSHHQIGLSSFGLSAPIKDIKKHFGFEPEQIASTVESMLSESQKQAAEFGVSPAAFVGVLAAQK